ncbi:MAG: wax ester/triacylglycerol synthase family O-acyltransferase [Chloroflexota bacterium]
MTQRGRDRRLSAQDASFLYFEKKESPLHIGSIAVFEGRLDYERFVDNIAAKINLIPRYQQIVMPAPFNIGHPTWEWDPNFYIRRHISTVRLEAPGAEEQLFEVGAKLFSTMLGRDKPLWEMVLIEGLEGGRSALLTKVHHCLVDGVSGIELLMLVMDISATPIPPAQVPDPEKDKAPPVLERFLDAILDNASTSIDSWASRQKRMVEDIGGAGHTRNQLHALETSLPYLQAPVVRAPFNKPLSVGRKVAFSEYSFQEIRQIRQAAGGTVNDVVLTVLGGGMAKYVEMHGQTTQNRTIRVLTPVNVRKDDERGALGNRISMLLIEVPVGIPDPLERLEAIRKRTEALKRRQVADGIESMGAGIDTTPPALQALLGSLPAPPNTFANMVCTNVPGPMIPLYTLGHRLQAHYPMIPLGWEMGISLGVTSYDQRLFFGFMGDAQAGSDVGRLKEFSDQAYVELRSAAGVEKSDLPQFGEATYVESKRPHRATPTAQAMAADAS